MLSAAELSDSWENFLSMKKSEFTKAAYIPCVKAFMEHFDIDDPDALLQGTDQEIDQRVIDYLKHLDQQDRKYNTRNKAYSAIWMFYTMNNKALNDRYIRNFVGRIEDDKADDSEDVAYTPRQIIAIHNGSKSLQLRAATLLLYTTGMRIGAIALESKDQQADVMRVKDMYLYKNHNLIRLTVYHDSKTHRHYTFCSPQAKDALMNYFRQREQDGERITGNSYVFVRRKGKYSDGRYWERPATADQLYSDLIKILVRLGYRTPLQEGQRRHPLQPFHAFRKACNTTMIRARVIDAYRKLMLDHTLGAAEKPYAKTLPEQLLEDPGGYLSVLPTLTLEGLSA